MTDDQLERLLAALDAGPSIVEVIGAGASIATTAIAIAALLYARSQIQEAKASRELTRELEIQRAQPYVVAYTEESSATNLAIDLVIKNFGPTAATDVRIALDPWPERDARADESARVAIPTFPVLAPGQEWRTSWVWSPDRQNSVLPDRHEGSVTFLGIDDVKLESPVVLDLSVYAAREWIEVRGIHDAATALRDIRDNQKRWTDGISGPLSVLVRDGAAKDDRDREWAAQRRARREARLSQQQGVAESAPDQADEPPGSQGE